MVWLIKQITGGETESVKMVDEVIRRRSDERSLEQSGSLISGSWKPSSTLVATTTLYAQVCHHRSR